ncbi:MAG: DNA polymerase I [bacterium]|jgi:DNA polymerase-1|nr:DNA polymerase I [Planctomycetota bacterium]HIL52025.1 DNA polymerase I [Planctomycetota bacterium]
MTRIFLLDGTAICYRAHFAMARSGLTTTEGLPTGATYGFTMCLRRILRTEKPDLVAVAFDPPGPTFRHEQFKEYKATRERMPEDLVSQLNDIREVVRAHGIAIFERPGFEADDVIGTLTRQAEAAGCEVMLVTGDKDLMQLVGERVKLYNLFKPKTDLVIQGIAEVEEKFGTDPGHVIDVLAIMGDSSDNIPGVKGIGEKGATRLVAQFGSVAGVLAGIEKIKGKAREHIERDREQLLMSLDLVTIRTDVELEPGFEAIGPAQPDAEKLLTLFRRLDFQRLSQEVQEDSSAPQPEMQRDYNIVRTKAEFVAMEKELRAAGRFAWDTETTSLRALEASLVGISFSAAEGRAFYVPANLDPPIFEGGAQGLVEALGPLLIDPGLDRWAQNWKYDCLVMRGAGLEIAPPDFDTMLASFCAVGNSRRHNLDELALSFFDLRKIPTKDLIGTGKKQVSMDSLPVDQVGEYACEDADVTFRLRALLEEELEEQAGHRIFHEVDLPLVPVLAAMEARGICLDTKLLLDFALELEKDLESAVYDIQGLAGENFNLNSTKRLGEILFEKLRIQDAAGVKRPKRTKTGWATDHKTLSDKYPGVEIVSRLLEYRELAKLKSTYVDALPTFVNPSTGRVHCSFSQVSAATGRLACSDPNLQNIPVRTERGRRLRQAFVPRQPDEHGEWKLLAADYSQVELRIMAHFSADPEMVRAFAEDRDIHASTAARVFGIEESEVDRELRSRAKAINFGLLYGMGPARLGQETGLSIFEAREFIERYFESFPGVRTWIDKTLEEARQRGFVETLGGRRRRTPDLENQNSRIRSAAENAAVNTPIQGSAADIIKRAMIDLEACLAASDLSAEMLLQVHDELVLEVPESELDATRELVRECMEGAADLRVPLKVDFGHGDTWLEAH